MRRFRSTLSGVVTAPGPASAVLFEPDYSNESLSVNTGPSHEPNLNPGLTIGECWAHWTPPYVRGQSMATERYTILTRAGSGFLGSDQDQAPTVGCLHVVSNGTTGTDDFLIPAVVTNSAITAPGDATIWLRLSDVQIGAGAVGDGLAYPGSPVPENNSQTANIGDTLSNQNNVSAGSTEHVRVNGTIDYSTVTSQVYNGPTINHGDTVTAHGGTVYTYTGASIVNGVSYNCVSVPIVRAQESTEAIISAGDCLKVSTGDVNPSAGFSSRSEVYDRFPPNATSVPPPNWPDPVGSIRWYRIGVYLPAGMDTTTGGTSYFTITQWKGSQGGSPPLELEADFADGVWKLASNISGNTFTSKTLGAIQLGQWTTFIFGISLDFRLPSAGGGGWVVVYRDIDPDQDPSLATPIVAQFACATMETYATASVTGTVDNGSNQITVTGSRLPHVWDRVSIPSASNPLSTAGGSYPAGTIVTDVTGEVVTLSNNITITAGGEVTGSKFTFTSADPIYSKQGIYRSTAWQSTQEDLLAPLRIGTTIDAMWPKDSTPSAPPTVYVNAAPSGPSTPEEGWEAIAADGFNSTYPLSDIFWPNRTNIRAGTTYTSPDQDIGNFENADEVATFNSSQLALTTQGAELTAVCINATKTAASYRSGAMWSGNNAGVGAVTGFQFKPTVGKIIALETVIKLATIGGADLGYWSSAGNYEEIDYFEQWNWTNSANGAQYPAMGIGVWFGTNASVAFNSGLNLFQTDNASPFTSPCADGKQHRWTTVIDGTNQTVSTYLDGEAFTTEDYNNGYAHRSSVGVPWPTGALFEWQFILYSFALRDDGTPGNPPPYIIDEGDTTVVRSFAAYVPTGSADSSWIQGGLIAPGTTVS